MQDAGIKSRFFPKADRQSLMRSIDEQQLAIFYTQK